MTINFNKIKIKSKFKITLKFSNEIYYFYNLPNICITILNPVFDFFQKLKKLSIKLLTNFYLNLPKFTVFF